MKEIRRARIIFTKNGQGATTTKLTLPVSWTKELGFNENQREAILEIIDNRITIRNAENILLIKEQNVKYVSSYADYELEDGTLLFEQDWNGELYRNGWKDEKDTNYEYVPVYKFQLDNIDINNIKENSDEWLEAVEIVGFKIR